MGSKMQDLRERPFAMAEAAAAGGFRVAVMQGAGVAVLRTVAQYGSGEDFEIYCVDRSRERIRALWEASSAERWRDRVVLFHGSLPEFSREIGASPSVIVAQDAEEILGLWGGLPAGCRIAVQNVGEGLRKWAQAGWIEREAESEGGAMFRTGGRHDGLERVRPPHLFQKLRAGLNHLYFASAAGGEVFGEYTPASSVIGEAMRTADLDDPANSARSGYGAWPYSRRSGTKLPDHMPNGGRWPLISVVTPSFQQGQYLEETILSVAQQNYPRVEHIVMDGGSTDGTTEVMRRYSHRLAAAISEKDRGQSHAINKGMAIATGEILTWLNSDDCLAPDALAGVAMGFHTSGADVVAGVVDLMAEGKMTGRHMTSCNPGPLPLDDLLDLDGGWNAGKFFYQPEVMFSRAIWEKAGAKVREDLYYSMDYDLWVRFAEAGARLHVIGRTLARFRIHTGQKTNVEAKFKAELQKYREDFLRSRGLELPDAGYKPPAKHRLKIVMLNDHGYEYGAGIAHKRTAESLILAGHEVTALSLRATAGDGKEQGGLTANDVLRGVQKTAPDLIIAGNLHSAAADPWILGALAEKFPTHCVLHDFWAITGRCAYPAGCEQYLQQCTPSCPTAGEYPSLPPDKIADAYRRKQDILFSRTKLSILANSDWTATVAREAFSKSRPGATAAPVARFRLSFPLDVFQPLDKNTCRRMLGLPEDRFIVMMSGDVGDKRKRAQMAFDALKELFFDNLTVIATGWTPPDAQLWLKDVRRVGHIREAEKLAQYYAAADLYISPSSGETFGQVFLEAIACGTPTIGFANSGIREAVREGVTGMLSVEETVPALANAIRKLYGNAELRDKIAAWGRIYVENEWSPEAAYYHLFLAWRELGLLKEWGMPPKISFQAQVQATSKPATITPANGISFHEFRMGDEEGPYPDYGLGRFRWAYGPVSEFLVHSPSAGKCSLVLRYRNVQPDQKMRVVVNGQQTLELCLPVTGIDKGKLACAGAELQAGYNQVRLEFANWQKGEGDPRPLAAALTEICCLPDWTD